MWKNTKEYQRAYYAAHRQLYLDAQKRYREKKKREQAMANPNPRLFDMREDYKTPTKEEFQSVPTKELTYSQKYYAENKEKIRAKQKETREKNKRLQKQRAYYAAHRERILEQQRLYQKKKTQEKKMSKTFLGRLTLKFKSLFK